MSYGVSADGLGNVFIAGETLGNLGGANAGGLDAFVSKYDAVGNLEWTQQLGTSSFDENRGISVDGLGNVYVSGYTSGDLDGLNLGNVDAFVSKYDAMGNLDWIEQLGTNSIDESFGVSADKLGNVFISGFTQGNIGDVNAGGLDAFVVKIIDADPPQVEMDFELTIGGNGDLLAINLSNMSIKIDEITIDFSQGGNDTFFDTTDSLPGVSSTGFSETVNEGAVVITLPDDTATDGEQSATIGFDGFDPGDVVGMRFDLDILSNTDQGGEPIGGLVTALFSNGQTLTKTIGDFPFSISGTTLEFSTATQPIGDYNGDGTIDAADYTVWRNTQGATGIGLAADGNGDGIVNGEDYDLWKDNFGSAASATSVPEPTAALLTGLMLAVLSHLPSRE